MELNRKNMQKIAILIAFAVLLSMGLEHISNLFHGLGTIIELISPFLLGGCIAFVLNVPMTGIEKHLFQTVKSDSFLGKSKRIWSLLLTLGLIIGGIVIAVGIIVPQLGHSITMLTGKMPVFWRSAQRWSLSLQERFPWLTGYFAEQTIDWNRIDWQSIGKKILEFLQSGAVGDMLGSTFHAASSIVGGIVNFFLGLFFAIYILLQKEKLGQQAEKILYAALPEGAVQHILAITALTHKTFANFIAGQCTEAVILGLLFFFAMSLFHFPYALLIGVFIAFTALIPIFGAFIGCAVGVFLILVESPVQAAWFIVLFLVLQQIEGNLIYPHVVGGSVGLPSIWVLVAVTLGASTFGIVGMLIFIPLFSVIYALIREATYHKLAEKQILLEHWDMPSGDTEETESKKENR